MPKGRNLNEIFKPLLGCPLQSHLGKGVHTLGLLDWILRQTGRADIYVSTYSTSDAFLRGFYNLRKKGLVGKSVLMVDLKASKKTVKLYREMQSCFDSVFLSMNHSKVVLVQSEKGDKVCIITSQNLTRGNRNESYIITTDVMVFDKFLDEIKSLIKNHSVPLSDILGQKLQQ